ncbi:hypothetical protein FEM48_Zijuj01G0057500 [Ziziphus jujuba var. spinosa]|uniref:Uncharacterized protein n=1 Tax=Ziziphus jujuba var. spinosa TaxID=714518 RepID=A0A978VZG7_ZIZJJ|nr:hypothetical protein FEM48_Zijuj01G0057500 [Ziziphus jujuba var. spinosa]
MLKLPAISRYLRIARTSSISLPSYISLSVFKSPHLKSTRRFLGLSKFAKSSAPSPKALLSDLLKNRRLEEAREAFDNIPCPSVYLFTMMIMGYARNHRLDDALKLFYEMPIKDTVCWNSMIKGCLDCGNLSKAKEIFDGMPGKNVISWTTIINGLMLFGDVEKAELLFHEMPTRDVATWNSMIYGYCSNGRVEDAINLFEVMPHKNVISWTSMIGGLDQNGKSDEALFLFEKMVGSGFEPTSTTLVSVLTACANLLALYLGVQIHGQILKLGYCFDEFLSASLITFYANCKQIKNACKVFEEMLNKNVVVWTALLTGYCLNCKHENALKVLGHMITVGVLPNQSSFTSALNACCGLEALDRGREIHSPAIKLGSSWVVLKGLRHEFLSGDRTHPLSESIYKKLDWLGGKLKEFGRLGDGYSVDVAGDRCGEIEERVQVIVFLNQQLRFHHQPLPVPLLFPHTGIGARILSYNNDTLGRVGVGVRLRLIHTHNVYCFCCCDGVLFVMLFGSKFSLVEPCNWRYQGYISQFPSYDHYASSYPPDDLALAVTKLWMWI